MHLLGKLLIFLSLLFFVLIFAPVVSEEAKYSYKQVTNSESKFDPTPPNTDFSIVIPKIEAKAPVIKNVSTTDESIYRSVLKRGVAHAQGTAFPGEIGNSYLFAHSTDAFYNVGYYNAVFYLIGKLDKGDEVIVYYNGEEIKYTVDYKKVVSPSDVKYLGNLGENQRTLTLQTCYPPGTTLKRLIVVANQELP